MAIDLKDYSKVVNSGKTAPMDSIFRPESPFYDAGTLQQAYNPSRAQQLFDEVADKPGYRLTIDLPLQLVVKPDGSELPFEVRAFEKYCLVNGQDDIELTLRHAEEIRGFEAARIARMPWLTHSQQG